MIFGLWRTPSISRKKLPINPGTIRTLRGPAFKRHDNFRGFELHILRKGSGDSQYGFCTPDFKRGEGYTGEGCGDDGNSWAWDG